MVVLGPHSAGQVAAQATRQFIQTVRFPAEPAAPAGRGDERPGQHHDGARLRGVLLCMFGAGVLILEFVRFIVVFPDAAVLAAALELPLVLVGFVLLRRLRPVHAPARRWSAAARHLGRYRRRGMRVAG